MVRMKQSCRETVWWPGIDQNIEEMVRACVACVSNGNHCKLTGATPPNILADQALETDSN